MFKMIKNMKDKFNLSEQEALMTRFSLLALNLNEFFTSINYERKTRKHSATAHTEENLSKI